MASIPEMEIESRERRLKRNLAIAGVSFIVSFLAALELTLWFSIHRYHWSLFVVWNLWTLDSLWLLGSIIGIGFVFMIANEAL